MTLCLGSSREKREENLTEGRDIPGLCPGSSVWLWVTYFMSLVSNFTLLKWARNWNTFSDSWVKCSQVPCLWAPSSGIESSLRILVARIPWAQRTESEFKRDWISSFSFTLRFSVHVCLLCQPNILRAWNICYSVHGESSPRLNHSWNPYYPFKPPRLCSCWLPMLNLSWSSRQPILTS